MDTLNEATRRLPARPAADIQHFYYQGPVIQN